MKRIFGVILLLIILIPVLCFLGSGRDDAAHKKDASSDSVIISDSDTGEDNDMRREFCTVERLDEQYFVLRNTNDELYRIDNAHLGSYKAGDQVLLIYLSRTETADGCYTAEVYAIHPDNNTLQYPAR